MLPDFSFATGTCPLNSALSDNSIVDMTLVFEPTDRFFGVVGQDNIRTRPFEAKEGFQDYGFVVQPALH